MKYRVQAMWNNFRTQVMPPNAPTVQVQEMRRAFYAGVECTLNRLAGEMTEGDGLDDPADERVVQEVNAELKQFAADVKSGKA
jgi:hypothetical protein